jgi:hypothetical protein
MTQQEAKELSLEVWRYLRDHPKIRNKNRLPKHLYAKIENLAYECPLCHILICYKCPLNTPSLSCEYFSAWGQAECSKKRQEVAAEIVRRIEAWEPEVEK